MGASSKSRSRRAPSSPPASPPAAAIAGVDEAVRLFHDWFAGRGWEAFQFQEDLWRSMHAGASGLLHAPTGTGKTLAAWLGAVARLGAAREDAAATPPA
ncbi:MAG: DNA ligase-associated DEXH box helicase, partial [Planctomycetota bacterium]|nr:DNA ligase-associated DEXH box helicase [Planctomycetota bacterium]